MPSEKDIFRRALGRLTRVPPEVLSLSRQRIRGNLRAGLRPKEPLPLPDATPADLSDLRRPFYTGGAMALVCLLVVGGALVLWRFERTSAPALVGRDENAKSASMQTSESQAAAPPPVIPELPKPNTVQPSRPATQPQSAVPPQVPARPPRAQLTPLPPGEGKVILDRACGACHLAASVGAYHYATRAEYAEVVSRMIAMGAQVSEQEAPVLTSYLFDNLAAKPEREVDLAGGAILERACTSCHSLNGIENYSYDSEGPYRELVSTMVSYGATLSEAEKAALIRYLFTTYGKR